MTEIVPKQTLPTLIDCAANALVNARSHAEVMEARDLARVAYDAAKSMARIHKVKQAHDSILTQTHAAQADATSIRARAEVLLAQEYDAAQARGEIAVRGGNGNNQFGNVADKRNLVTAADLGLRRNEIHEARKLRDAEEAQPGIIERTLQNMVERGEEPTRAALKREIIGRPQCRTSSEALWLWGRVNDFRRVGIFAVPPADLAAKMTPEMRESLSELIPTVCQYLNNLKGKL